MGGAERKTKAGTGIRKIPDSIRNFAILPIRGSPWGSVGFRGAFRRGGHQRPTPNAEIINRRNRRGWLMQKENRKAGTGIRKIPGDIRNFPILPFSGVAWGSGRRSEGAASNAQHSAEMINKRNHLRRAAPKENERLIRESVKFRDLFVISKFYRPVAPRGIPGGFVGRGH